MDNEKLEQLEQKVAELQNEICIIKIKQQRAKTREEDRLLTQEWRESGLLPEDWCIHKVIFGRRVYYKICDVPNYYDWADNISIRFYTPDCTSDERRDICIRNVLQSIQIPRNKPAKKRPVRR